MRRDGVGAVLGAVASSALVLGFSGALLDFILTLVFRPQTLALVGHPLLAPAATASFLIVVSSGTWVIGMLALRLVLKPDPRALAVGVALAHGVTLVLILLHYGLQFPLWLGPLRSLTIESALDDLHRFKVVMFPLAAAIGIVTERLVHWLVGRGVRSDALLAPTLALLAVAGETGALVASGGRGRTAALGWRWLAWAVVVGLTLWAWARLGRAARPTRLVAAYLTLVTVLVVGLAAAWRSSESAALGSGRSDHPLHRVILLTVDTVRQDAVSCYGGHSATPHFDRLADDGIRFADAYAPSGWTMPSFASMLTGVSPFVHRATARDSWVPEAFVTVAERMLDAGYGTAAIGANVFLALTSNLDQGFSRFDFFPKFLPMTVSFGSTVLWGVNHEDGSARNLTDRAEDWLRRNRDRDFFLWIHYLDPHGPYAPPPEFAPPGPPPPGTTWYFDQFRQARDGLFVPNAEQRSWIRALYEGDVRYVDAQVGRLLATLDELGLYDETLIVFAGDHGEELWDHASCEHGHTLYDELLRVPLVIKPPRSHAARPGTVVSGRVCVGSVAPTILDLCGLDLAAEREPRSYPSLAPECAAGGGAVPDPAPLVATGLLYYENREAVLFDEFKFIRTVTSGHEELYDLRTDPGEQHSLVLVRPEIVERGRKILDEIKAHEEQIGERYGVRSGETLVLDPAAARGLKALGYLQ